MTIRSSIAASCVRGVALVAAIVLFAACPPEPGELQVQVTPEAPLVTQDLQAELVDPPEQADQYVYRWFVDGAFRQGLSEPVLPADLTRTGEVWGVVVTALANGVMVAHGHDEARIHAVPTDPDPDLDGDGFRGSQDCDDSNPAIHPDADEVCNGIDDDCDGVVDEEQIDADGDGSLECFDCDDADPDRTPGAPELCEPGSLADQRDNNCDPSDDADSLVEFRLDADGDGYGVAAGAEWLCGPTPEGRVPCSGDCPEDCDDADPAVFPGAAEICDGLDNDCDGVQAPDDVDADLDGRPACGTTADGDPLDCDDSDPTVFRGAAELCDGQDNDCMDGIPGDEVDNDLDGWAACAADQVDPPFMLQADCDDDDPAINPGMSEVACDLVDNDCNGLLHPDETDADIDLVTECGPDGVPGTADDDCDDSNPTVLPGASELCDALDNDCDGVVPTDELDPDNDGYVGCSEEPQPWPTGYWGIVGHAGGDDCHNDPTEAFFGPHAEDIYPNAPELSDSYSLYDEATDSWELVLIDNQCPGDPGFDASVNIFPFEPDPGLDGTGNQEYCTDSSIVGPCVPGSACYACTGSELDEDLDGYSEARGDCDDADPSRAPWLSEICDGVDNDCDGFIPLSEVDGDNDGYVQCWPPPDVTGLIGGDCDDSDQWINPGRPEIVNGGIDDDCDSTTVEPDAIDEDGDGATADIDCDDLDSTIYPGAPELCDQLDNDCDGLLGDGTVGPDERDQDGDGYTICGDLDCIDSGAQLVADYLAATGDLYLGTTANAEAAAAAIHPGAAEVCDGWDNDCQGQAGALFLPDDVSNPNEFDDDEDGYVECEDYTPADIDTPAVSGWTTWADQANQNLNGGWDCADTPADIAPAVALSSTDPMGDISPGGDPGLCDGWDNDCSGNYLDRPFALAGSTEWDDDLDQYLECTGWVNTGQVNDNGDPILGGGDCLDEQTTHFVTGELITLAVAALVNPGATEVCDGFDTDCSQEDTGPTAYAATEINSPLEEGDADEDGYIGCTAFEPSLAPGYGVGDCLDEAQPHFQTGEFISLALAAQIHPDAAEVCDGFNTDCSLPLDGANAYDANDANTHLEEDDTDEDGFVECTEVPAPDSLAPGFGRGDCLDELTQNPDTGAWMQPDEVGVHVNPGATEACDGLNTDCSSPLAANVWEADDANSLFEEDDADGDLHLECEAAAAWTADVGYDVGDCLDEVTTHFDTGQVMGLTVAAAVNPGATELCDGLDTDCSQEDTGEAPYDATDANSTMEEDDTDHDLWLECSAATETVASYILEVGYGTGDCLDEETVHFETGAMMSAAGVGYYVHPNDPAITWDVDSEEFCDGLNTDCSGPLATAAYDATAANSPLEEDDGDGDGWLMCEGAVPWSAEVGYGAGDCLDGDTFNPRTGAVMTAAAVGVHVNPAATEVCDGLNTDCDGDGQWQASVVNSTLGEADADEDLWLACETAWWSLDVGYLNGPGVNDCLDEVTFNDLTGATMDLSVAAQVNPAASEVCDGLNTDCSFPLSSRPWDASDANSTMEEDDTDQDNYLECDPAASWIAEVGYGTGDCLDETTTHFETGATMTASGVGVNVHPGATEVCDGLNTDCSAPLASEAYDANDSNSTIEEDDADSDTFVQCAWAASWMPEVGMDVGDCLDEATVDARTGGAISLALAALVNPGRPEVCDGFNTDCSAPLASVLYDPQDAIDGIPNTPLAEGDYDDDLWLECALSGISDAPGYQSEDCDDIDAWVNPGELDDWSAADPDAIPIDNDCDGIADEESLSVGDVVISEIQPFPSLGQTNYEWFEIRNLSGHLLDLEGWVFTDDGADEWTIPGSLLVGVDQLAVLCRDPDGPIAPAGMCANVGVSGPYPWSSDFSLGNTADEIQVNVPCTGEVAPCTPAGDLELDEVAWDSSWDFTSNRGWSKGVDPDITTNLHVANDDASNWCFSTAPWPGQGPINLNDRGTPNADNSGCDSDLQDNDLDGWCEEGRDLNLDGDCNDPGEDAANFAECVGGVCDCDDSDDEVYVAAVETCDWTDSDCDGSLVDEFPDHDGDGEPNCIDSDDDNDGVPDSSDDCDLGDIGWTTTDFDGDGCRDETEDADDDNDGDPDVTDCDDNDDQICSTTCFDIPGDGIDQDCDGADAEARSEAPPLCWLDADSDGFGSTPTGPAESDACPAGEAPVSGDCNDLHPRVHPDALLPELPGSSATLSACLDHDGDGHCLGGGLDLDGDGDCQDEGEDLGAFAGGAGDCDETVAPLALPESVVDGLDDDGDGLIDEDCLGGGEVLLTEYYSQAGTDWLELLSASWFDLALDGWWIGDPEQGLLPLEDGWLLPTGGRLLLCAGSVFDAACLDTGWSDPVGDLGIDPDQQVVLLADELEIDAVALTGPPWAVPWPNTALQLDRLEGLAPLAGVFDPDNGDPSSWCPATEPDPWSAGTGTPGEPNQVCP